MARLCFGSTLAPWAAATLAPDSSSYLLCWRCSTILSHSLQFSPFLHLQAVLCDLITWVPLPSGFLLSSANRSPEQDTGGLDGSETGVFVPILFHRYLTLAWMCFFIAKTLGQDSSSKALTLARFQWTCFSFCSPLYVEILSISCGC